MADSQPTQEEIENMSPEQIAELQQKNCVFCKIISGEIPSRKVYEGEELIAILDIYPAAKGHVLIMPKKHIQIMQLMPASTFKEIFRKLRYVVRGVKDGVPSSKSTIFIANGGVAGQQSPHFLFHIIPRDSEDGVDNFDIPSKKISQDELFEPLKSSLTKMMEAQLAKDGKVLAQEPSKDDLAQIIDKNPQLKEMIINNPEQLKKEMETNQKLQLLFKGTNIDKLSDILKQIEVAKQTLAKQEADAKQSQPPKNDETTDDQTKQEQPEKDKEEEPKDEQPEKDKEEEPKDDKNMLDKIAGMFTK